MRHIPSCLKSYHSFVWKQTKIKLLFTDHSHFRWPLSTVSWLLTLGVSHLNSRSESLAANRFTGSMHAFVQSYFEVKNQITWQNELIWTHCVISDTSSNCVTQSLQFIFSHIFGQLHKGVTRTDLWVNFVIHFK